MTRTRTHIPFTGLRGRFSVFAVQKHRYLRRSQKREVFTTPLSPVKSPLGDDDKGKDQDNDHDEEKELEGADDYSSPVARQQF
jgi:hypothetical protein